MAWRGGLVTVLILAGVGLILVLNQEPPTNTPGNPSSSSSSSTKPAGEPAVAKPAVAPVNRAGLESPIGEEVERNHIRVAAVRLASVGMDGRPISEGQKLIHLEADIRATSDNPNGFARDEFIPYLKLRYKILPKGGDKPIQFGEMVPMVAFDGLHYGANIEEPKPGDYDLVYEIEPPSAGGLGRHSDPVTGVAPWWEPFQVSFEWRVEPTK